MQLKTWQGSEPKACDVCAGMIVEDFVDGRTRQGPWGILCPRCHRNQGVGLGTGKGQHYHRQDGVWLKVGG